MAITNFNNQESEGMIAPPSFQHVNYRPTSVLTYDIMSVGYKSHLGRLHHHLKSLQFVDDMLILSYTVNLRRFFVFSGTPVG